MFCPDEATNINVSTLIDGPENITFNDEWKLDFEHKTKKKYLELYAEHGVRNDLTLLGNFNVIDYSDQIKIDYIDKFNSFHRVYQFRYNNISAEIGVLKNLYKGETNSLGLQLWFSPGVYVPNFKGDHFSQLSNFSFVFLYGDSLGNHLGINQYFEVESGLKYYGELQKTEGRLGVKLGLKTLEKWELELNIKAIINKQNHFYRPYARYISLDLFKNFGYSEFNKNFISNLEFRNRNDTYGQISLGLMYNINKRRQIGIHGYLNISSKIHSPKPSLMIFFRQSY